MIIALPGEFFYSTSDCDRAFVENGILYIEGRINFEGLMYSLTYSLKGYSRCKYCGRELLSNKRTMDHMYPRVFGGVSIPDNLVPSCPSCNSRKSCLTAQQFYHWRRFQSTDKRERIFKKMVESNMQKIKNGILLPKEWITYYDVTEVLEEISFDEVSRDKEANERVEMFYFKYQHYSKPILVSKNGWVFTGFHTLYHAKRHSIKNVPAIVLENVVHLSH